MRSSALWSVRLLAFLVLLHLGEGLLVPLLFAALVAQLLTPLVRRFERYGSTALAVLFSLVIAFGVFGWVVYLVVNQLTTLQDALPQLQQRLIFLVQLLEHSLERHFGLTHTKALTLFYHGLENSLSAGGTVLMTVINVTAKSIADGALVVILAFLLLYFRRHFHRQLKAMAELHGWSTMTTVLDRISGVGQKYMVGFVAVIALVGTLDTVGMFLVRAPFPVLFGVMGAAAVLIPFVGIVIVAPLMVLFAYAATGSLTSALLVLLVYAVVHFLEGNVFTPTMVGSSVDLNPFFSLVAVIVGGEVWGIVGMLLFIPLCGILKLTFDAMPSAQPLSHLLGPVAEEDREPLWRRRHILRLKAEGKWKKKTLMERAREIGAWLGRHGARRRPRRGRPRARGEAST